MPSAAGGVCLVLNFFAVHHANISPELRARVISYIEHSWSVSRGLDPDPARRSAYLAVLRLFVDDSVATLLVAGLPAPDGGRGHVLGRDQAHVVAVGLGLEEGVDPVDAGPDAGGDRRPRGAADRDPRGLQRRALPPLEERGEKPVGMGQPDELKRLRDHAKSLRSVCLLSVCLLSMDIILLSMVTMLLNMDTTIHQTMDTSIKLEII